jgi:RNA polymerase-binding transcription factor DksA
LKSNKPEKKKTVTKKAATKKAATEKKKNSSVKVKKVVTKKATQKATGRKITEKKVEVKKAVNTKKNGSSSNAKKKVQSPKPVKSVQKNNKQTSVKRKLRYTSKELEHFKQILLEERKSIIESAQANMKSLVDNESGEYVGDNLTYASHMAEQGSDEMEREKNYLFVQRDEKYLGYIQEALIRIEQGIYGVCIECIDKPKLLCPTCPLIPKERLEVVPITQHCIECKKIRS